MKFFRGLINAFSYFTILPVPSSEDAPGAYAIGWLPLVGAVVGYAAGWGAYGTFLLTHSQLWCAIAAFALTIILTGGIHIDGFLDCCDALLATTSVERRLEILKDPHHGSYAIIGMSLLAIVWLASLYGIAPESMPVLLASVGLLSRAAVLQNIATYKHASTKASYPKVLYAFGYLWTVPIILQIGQSWGRVGFTIAAIMISTVWAWLLSRRLGGGLTGDVYGAVIVITEVGLLKLFALYPWLVQ